MELIEKPFTHPDLLAKVREVLAAPAGDQPGCPGAGGQHD